MELSEPQEGRTRTRCHCVGVYPLNLHDLMNDNELLDHAEAAVIWSSPDRTRKTRILFTQFFAVPKYAGDPEFVRWPSRKFHDPVQTPRKLRPVFRAAIAVVPDPMQQSRTSPPSVVYVLIKYSQSATGLCVGKRRSLSRSNRKIDVGILIP